MGDLLTAGLFLVAWVGHACVWVSVLSNLYGRPLPKRFLTRWRAFTGLVILAFPLLLLAPDDLARPYLWPCAAVGGVVLPLVTLVRLFRATPAVVVSESTRTLDLWRELGRKLIGDGHYAAAGRLPGNGAFRVDFTDLVLAPPGLPAGWDGLTMLVVSDLHFHGSPARPFFDRVVDELAGLPAPDLVCLVGDYVDTDTHREWIRPLLGRLTATGAKLAILGNHDQRHDPDSVRAELEAAGYVVLGNGWRELTVRGEAVVAVGHEGPWFRPAPDLSAAPPDRYRLCLSHTPDNFYWGVANQVGLMLCGHVHGGAIRVPLVGSIFVPSKYGRRFDQGVFQRGGTVMVVGRGLSGKEPIRFGCNPQVLRVTLVRRDDG
ncbi:MAG: metallophosphoesterase [Isosphaera sp.]|nr:metallophosphoesterase [Isosphaera sp.]